MGRIFARTLDPAFVYRRDDHHFKDAGTAVSPTRFRKTSIVRQSRRRI